MRQLRNRIFATSLSATRLRKREILLPNIPLQRSEQPKRQNIRLDDYILHVSSNEPDNYVLTKSDYELPTIDPYSEAEQLTYETVRNDPR